MGNSLIAQNYNKNITRDSIQAILDSASKYLVRLSHPNHHRGIHLLEKAESIANSTNQPSLKILVNRYKVDYLATVSDTVLIKEYLARNLKLIRQINDRRELGLYYEQLGVLNSYNGKMVEETQAFLKASDLLTKFGKKRDLIDANYNLSIIYREKGEWEKSIRHIKISLDAIDDSDVKKNRRKHLYLFLAQNYTNLGKYKEVEASFRKIEDDDFFKVDDPYYSGFLNKAKGRYYREINDLEKSIDFYNRSTDNFYEYGLRRTKNISSSLTITNQLKLKEEENKVIKIQNELNMQELKNNKYIFLIGLIIIVGLLLISINQYKTSKFRRKLNELLKNKNNELFMANQEVDKALQVKSDFLDSITHELLTPLNTIKGITFLLKKDGLTKDQKDQINLLGLSSDYLLELINNVIDLSVLEKDKVKLNNTRFNLKLVLNNLVNSLYIIRNNNVLHSEIDNNIPDFLEGDVLRIAQVVINILNNAMKFTDNGDVYFKVSLESVFDNKARVKFYFRDSGIGMSKSEKENIFENFNQGSVKINRNYGGTGLGLSIVKNILELYKSKIIVNSEIDKGTTLFFSIDFNISDEYNYSKNTDFDEYHRSIKVLLVEDNKVNQLLVMKIISDYGFHCDLANDGEEAVEMVKRNEYSIVLMDIMMPKMDGFEATKRIRLFDRKTPIVALTAILEKLNKKKFMEVGIHTVLNKPVKPKQLYETIIGLKSGGKVA